MAMYALAVTPLICRLKNECPETSQVWFADDATRTAATSCENLSGGETSFQRVPSLDIFLMLLKRTW